MKSDPILDTYRCPENVVRFDLDVPLPDSPGYFRFDEDLMCYGRHSKDRIEATVATLSDAGVHLSGGSGSILLPFDPGEIIDNLRNERYITRTDQLPNHILYRAYYLIRPILPVSVRKHFQAVRLNGFRRQQFPQWPMDCTVDRILERLVVLQLKVKPEKGVPFIWFWPETFA